MLGRFQLALVVLLAVFNRLSASVVQPNCPQGHPQIFVGILSSAKHFHRRNAIRETWSKDPRLGYSFVMGRPTSQPLLQEVWREASQHDDIIVVDHKQDAYENTTYSTLEIFRMGYALGPCYKYVMKVDDDSYLHTDNFFEWLAQPMPTPAFMGMVHGYSHPRRNPLDKWYVSEADWPSDTYPKYCQGGGYLMSWEIAKEVAVGGAFDTNVFLRMEDVSTGAWVENVVKRRNLQVHYIHDLRFAEAGCANNNFVSHKIGASQTLCIHKNKRCCEEHEFQRENHQNQHHHAADSHQQQPISRRRLQHRLATAHRSI